MTPRLHKIVYGWHPHHFGQIRRGAGTWETISVPDGLWITAYGGNGVFGMTALVSLSMLLIAGGLAGLAICPPDNALDAPGLSAESDVVAPGPPRLM